MRSQDALLLILLVLFILASIVWAIVWVFKKIFPILVIAFGLGLLYLIFYLCYTTYYFNSKKFKEIKESIKKYVDDCNDLNVHIQELSKASEHYSITNYGESNFVDTSIHNYRRPKKGQKNASNVYNCSATMCSNAGNQPIKYLCKYFNIEINEDTLNKVESTLNDYLSAEQGKTCLINQKNEILKGISNNVPWFINTFAKKKLAKKLGFQDVNLKNIDFPKYIFRYVSPGGYSSMQSEIVLNLNNLNDLVEYLGSCIKFQKSVAGQRALMTKHLREKIKNRDNYTCLKCGNSTSNEPNLLLEIDHKIPLSKGGLTTEDNLQTLCWRCNRSKGAKLETD